MSITIWLVFLAAYLLGAIPFGYLVAKIYNLDIRRYGSGNIGATNVLRVLGPVPGAIVLLLDLLKGTAAVILAQLVTTEPWIIVLAGALAILGHSFSVFLKFKGGRGAATGLGVLLGIAPEIFFGATVSVTILIALFRYVSVGSMLTSILVAVAFLMLNRPLPYTLVSALVSLLIIARHIPNIKRLLKGTEPKIGEKKL